MKYFNAKEILAMPEKNSDARVYTAEEGKNYFVNISYKDHAEKLIAESHTFEDDIYVVKEGGADLYLGGEIVNNHEISDGQWRGDDLTGDVTKYQISAGDMVFIPAGTPHMLDARNSMIKLVIVKVICGA